MTKLILTNLLKKMGDETAPQYIGVKIVHAYPMDEATHRKQMGHDVPSNSRDGYRVIYEGGYNSWSPKEEFDAAYRQVNNGSMSFGLAIEAMKKGSKVARKGWNGKNMFCFLVDGSTFKVNRAPLDKFYPEGTEVNYHAHIDMKTADGTLVPWLASQSDMLSDDWVVLD